MRVIYLDNNATTMVAPEALEAMLPFLRDLYGNPSSAHSFGARAGKRLDEAREQAAHSLHCAPDEIIFTSCGTESDNTAIFPALRRQPDKRHIITTVVEHPAVLNVCAHLEKSGYEITRLNVDGQGRLDLQELADVFRPDTALVSLMHSNNETGVMFPLRKASEIVKERGVLLHSDAVQSLGKVRLDMREFPVDYLALSGHKFHAPKGVGVLFVRREAPFLPWMLGGGQERGRRAGTENMAGIVALGKAMELATADLERANARVRALRDRLEQGVLQSVPDVRRNGDVGGRLPNTSSLAFKGIQGEGLVRMLDQFGICVGSGSACASGCPEPSHVLKAMGVPSSHVHGTIRFSLSRYTTKEEIDLVLRTLPELVSTLRSMPPSRGFEGTEDGGKRVCRT